MTFGDDNGNSADGIELSLLKTDQTSNSLIESRKKQRDSKEELELLNKNQSNIRDFDVSSDLSSSRSRMPSAHDGVFLNIPARPEIMVLPKDQDDIPPVSIDIFLE